MEIGLKSGQERPSKATLATCLESKLPLIFRSDKYICGQPLGINLLEADLA